MMVLQCHGQGFWDSCHLYLVGRHWGVQILLNRRAYPYVVYQRSYASQ